MDKRASIIEKAIAFKNAVIKMFPVKVDSFWVFGSHINGIPHKDSDIDIALIVDKLDDNYNFFETEPILWKLKEDIDFRIEPHLIARDTDYTGMIREIQKKGMMLK